MLLLFLCCTVLFAIDVPFSGSPIQNADNMFTGFQRIDPEDYAADSLNTKAWFWHDEDYLYAIMQSDTGKNFSKGYPGSRDSSGETDYMRIQLITIPDAYYAYMYLLQPSGTLSDGVRDQYMNVDYSWNSNYSYKVEIKDSLWTAEVKIPLRELRFSSTPPYKWKVILTRYHHYNNEFYSCPPVTIDKKKEYFGLGADITLHHKIKRSSDLKIMPYYVKSYDLINKTGSFDPDNVGMDISFNPGAKIKAKISLNPDFSNVPMDSATDYYNSKYPPYLNEERYFFTEDIDVFGVSSDTFYSRNIVQPQIAFKLTGNANTLSYGILGAKDKEIKSGDYLINADDYFQILALNKSTKNYNFQNNIISRMNTGYAFHSYNTMLKLDLPHDFYSRAYYSFTYREKEDFAIMRGHLGSASFSYNPKRWDASIYGSYVSPEIISDTGYYVEPDFIKAGWDFSYSSDNTDKYIRNWSVGTWGQSFLFNYSTDPISEMSQTINANISFKPGYGFSGNSSYSESRDAYDRLHQNYQMGMTANANLYKKHYFYGQLSKGNQLFFSLNESKDYISGYFYVQSRITDKASGSISMNLRWNDHPKMNTIVSATDTSYVYIDNVYQIINLGASYRPDNKTSVKMGLGLSTYESTVNYGNLSFYTNIAHEFRPNWFVYLGYKTRQIQDEKTSIDEPLGHYIRNMASAYLKLAVTL